jgi:deazaflavin-dependent oxidoreductase (nitroreductase family)
VPPPHHRLVHAVAATPTFVRFAPRIVPRVDHAAYRLTGGRYMLSSGMLPVIMLTTIGAKTRRARTVPLAAAPLDGELHIVASNFGQLRHPAWSANLLANPDALVGYRGERFLVRAERLADEEKAEVWHHLLEVWPLFDRYVETSGRNLRVFRLRRRPRSVI